MPKINTAGDYTTFRGVTIVSARQQQANDAWTLLYKRLQDNRLLRKYYSLTPLSSYHMTWINLATEEAIGQEQWPLYMSSNQLLFQILHDKIMSFDFNPMINVKGIHINRTIKLVLELPEKDKVNLAKIAEPLGLLNNIPTPFHITLGHQYQIAPRAVVQTIQGMLTDIIKPLHLLACYIEPAKLCYFMDMQAFIPWNGSYNPFDC